MDLAAAVAPAVAPKVSFGMPVLGQTMEDIEVVVSDNDRRDRADLPRYRRRRRAGALCPAGFRTSAWSATSALSPRRRAAPISSGGRMTTSACPDYAEKLSLLDAHPEAILAIGRVHWDDQVSGFFKSYKLPDTTEVSGCRRVARQFARLTPHRYHAMCRGDAAIAHLGSSSAGASRHARSTTRPSRGRTWSMRYTASCGRGGAASSRRVSTARNGRR
jgi:hypothetical protein